MSSRYLTPLNMMSDVRFPTIYMEEHLLEDVKPLNESLYLEGLVSTVAHVKIP